MRAKKMKRNLYLYPAYNSIKLFVLNQRTWAQIKGKNELRARTERASIFLMKNS